MASRKPKPNSALSSNSEFDQAGPRPARSTRVRRGRQVAAVDRRAAGGVGDQQPVAEELGEQLEVRRLAAAGAGAGDTRTAARGTARSWRRGAAAPCGRAPGSVEEEAVVGPFALAQRLLRLHVERLVARVALVLGRAHDGAEMAAGAVLGRHLDGVGEPLEVGRTVRRRDEIASGAPASWAGSYALARMAACGQTSAHWLHWMQMAGSHTGISSARLRFSHWPVPVGQVPSTGKALTGSASPLPASITAVTRCTKSGAAAATIGGRARGLTSPPRAARTSCRWARARSTAARFCSIDHRTGLAVARSRSRP